MIYDRFFFCITEGQRATELSTIHSSLQLFADELVSFEGVAYAVPSSRLREGSLPDNALIKKLI